MDSIHDIADKLERLRAYVRSIRGPGWNAIATQRVHDICVKVERTTTALELDAEAVEYCGENFNAAEAKIRQHLREGSGTTA